MAVLLDPVGSSFVARISGVDLTGPLSAETFAEIHQAFHTYAVLVFRDQPVTPAAHIALARLFGELEVHPVFPHHPDHPELVLLGGSADAKATENIYQAMCRGGRRRRWRRCCAASKAPQPAATPSG